jgi:dTMP kinase
MRRGLFISVEGIDGAGKSTHVPFIADYLRENGLTVVTTREPGGTPMGEQIRELLLHSSQLHQISELLLMFASRQELISQLIIPNLESSVCVVSDRFIDASIAYQAVGRDIGIKVVKQLAKLLQPNLTTDLTLIFDVSIDTAIRRLNRSRNKDRIENETQVFFSKVQQAYRDIASNEPERVKLISTEREVHLTRDEIQSHLDNLIAKHYAN